MSPARPPLPQEIASDALFGRWLRAQGLRLTSHRRAVLGTLRLTPAPLSVEALHKKIPKAHLVTLYRTLQMFERAGIVRKIGIDEERARFELAFDHHHHIVCISCQKIEDVELKETALERQALRASRQFRTVQNHSLEFSGMCKTCVANA